MLSGELSGAGGGEGSGTQEKRAFPAVLQTQVSSRAWSQLAKAPAPPWLATPSWPVFTLQTVQQGEGHAVTSGTQESP